MDEEKTTQEQEAEGTAAAEAEAETTETVAEAEKTTTGTVTDDAGDPEPAEKKSTEKIFTQKEVDDIVKKRLARAAKDSQTAAQMQQTIEAENAALRHSVACYKAGVKAECVEDAVALASKYVDVLYDFDPAPETSVPLIQYYAPNIASTAKAQC